MDSDFEDLEDTAAAVADWVYLKVMLRKLAGLLGLFAAIAAVIGADTAFGTEGAFLLPQWPGTLLGAFTGAYLASACLRYVVNRAVRRKTLAAVADGTPLTDGERTLADLERLRVRAPLPWQAGLLRASFLRWLTIRAVFSAAAGVVLVHLLGPVPGVPVAVAYTALAVAVDVWVPRAVSGAASAVLFTDTTRPRDTPEI